MGVLESALDERTALVSLSHTAFKSGYTYDLAGMTEKVHRLGGLVLWDLSHSVGVVPIDLEEAGADLAVGCTYKYLNGGPGSPAFLYVRRSLQGSLDNPITGWWGHAEPFDFDLDFRPTNGIRKFHSGTMPVISLADHRRRASRCGGGRNRSAESEVGLVDRILHQSVGGAPGKAWFRAARPREILRVRGSHVSLSHPDSWPIDRALIEVGKGHPRLPGAGQHEVRPRPAVHHPSGCPHCGSATEADRRSAVCIRATTGPGKRSRRGPTWAGGRYWT